MMNEKLVLELLKSKGFQNPDGICKVVSLTPNPNASLECILGLHEPIKVELSKRFRKHRYASHTELVEITAIDDLTNIVKHKVHSQKTQTVWYLTKADLDNNVYVTDRPKDYHTWNTIPVTGFTTTETSLSMERFYEDYTKEVSLGESFDIFDEWDNYGVFVEKDPTDLMLDDCH